MKMRSCSALFCLLAGLLMFSCKKDSEGDKGSGSEDAITKAEFEATLSDFTTYHVDVNSADIQPGPAGAGANWDFSEYETPAATISTQEFQCPGQDACSEFTEANRISLTQGAGYSYAVLSDEDYLRIGGKGLNGAVTTYTDPETVWQFPLEFQKSFSDSYAQTSTTGEVITGEKNVEIDGYGTLKTASGTFPNTIRIKITQNIVALSPFKFSASVISYVWLNKNYKGGLLLQILYSETILEGQTTPSGFSKSLIYTKPDPL